jgi:hypothetical protein
MSQSTMLLGGLQIRSIHFKAKQSKARLSRIVFRFLIGSTYKARSLRMFLSKFNGQAPAHALRFGCCSLSLSLWQMSSMHGGQQKLSRWEVYAIVFTGDGGHTEIRSFG